MKKMPRKFSEGGTAQPKPAEPKKPADTMPDWAKKDLKDKNADAATKQGYEAATAKDRLKKFKKGGSIKKFAEGGKFSSDVYERARNQIKDRFSNSQEEETTGLDELIKTSPKEKSEAPKAKSSAAPKAAPKPAAKPAEKSEAKPAEKPVAKKDDASTESSDVNSRIKSSLARLRAKSLADAEERFNKSSYSQQRGGGPMAPPSVSSGRVTPTSSKSEADSGTPTVNERLRRFFGGLEERELARSRARAGLPADPSQVYKSGGKVAKYAKGGGVESKGKTKGTVVKMAKGGSVKGWGISRGAKACKMV